MVEIRKLKMSEFRELLDEYYAKIEDHTRDQYLKAGANPEEIERAVLEYRIGMGFNALMEYAQTPEGASSIVKRCLVSGDPGELSVTETVEAAIKSIGLDQKKD